MLFSSTIPPHGSMSEEHFPPKPPGPFWLLEPQFFNDVLVIIFLVCKFFCIHPTVC